VPPALPIEEDLYRPGELDGVTVQHQRVGEVDHSQQHAMLGSKPAQDVGGALRRNTSRRRIQHYRYAVRAQQSVREVRRVQVMIEQPDDRRAPVRVRLLLTGAFGGVRVEQVVQRIAACRRLRNQVRAHELAQPPADLVRSSARDARRRPE
jgi:hypothetical protein